jgi:hypothetical protein
LLVACKQLYYQRHVVLRACVVRLI